MFTEKTYTVNYLFPYMFKGNKHLHALISSASPSDGTPDIRNENEFTLHLKARKICSMV